MTQEQDTSQDSRIGNSPRGWWSLDAGRPMDRQLPGWQVQSAREAVCLAVALIVACVCGRLWLEQPNFKPSLAAALLAGLLIPNWRWAVSVPLVSTVITDWWLGFYEWPLMLTVYACLLLPTGWFRYCQSPLERCFAQRQADWSSGLVRLGLLNVGAVAAALMFYASTSFVVWAATPWYSQDWSGLTQAYLNALPFLRWMLQGNLCFLNLMITIWCVYRGVFAWGAVHNDAQPALPQ